jgi:hypothetical protein
MVAIVAVIKYFLLLNDVIIFGAYLSQVLTIVQLVKLMIHLDGTTELKMAKMINFLVTYSSN